MRTVTTKPKWPRILILGPVDPSLIPEDVVQCVDSLFKMPGVDYVYKVGTVTIFDGKYLAVRVTGKNGNSLRLWASRAKVWFTFEEERNVSSYIS